MIFLTFLTAIALSAVAAYYSVIGLAEIFPGSFWPVVIMGGVLEASKLVTVSWLYRNWHRAGILLKGYLSVAVTILMLITSMGIFGYLSKAHLEHSSDTSPLQSKVELLEEKIRVDRESIEESRKELKQLDAIVDQTVGRTTDEKGILQAQALRRTQQKDRSRLVSQIELSQKNIAVHREELAPLSVELKKAEADLGPIKYVAALAYGEEAGTGVVEKAVRLVIGLIIVVFDPLAILLLIAGNISLANHNKITEVKPPKKEEPSEPVGFVAQEFGSVLPEAITSEQQANTYITQADINSMLIKSVQEQHDMILGKHPPNNHAYLNQPFKHFENLKPMVQKKESPGVETKTVEIPQDNLIIIDEASGDSIPPLTQKVEIHHAPGFYEEHHVPVETKYDYDDSYSFREKDKK